MTDKDDRTWLQRRWNDAKENPHLVLVPLLAIVGMAGMWVQWWLTPWLISEAHKTAGYDAQGAISMQGTYGDMFGATNSLFSGFAMIFAMSAIILQVFEFRLQRQELGLQLDEMVANNATSEKRFELDERIFEYDQRQKLRELLSQFQKPAVQDGLRILAGWNYGAFNEISEVSRYFYDVIAWDERVQLSGLNAHGQPIEFGREFTHQRDKCGKMTPLMEAFCDLHVYAPSDDDLRLWSDVLGKFDHLIEQYAIGASRVRNVAVPIWAESVIALISRHRNLTLFSKGA